MSRVLLEILPSKKFIKKQLFDLDSRYSYKKLLPVYRDVYENKPLPNSINGSDLIIMKKVLEKYRGYSSIIDRNLVGLENQLVEKAGEYGNNDAILLLAFETLMLKDTKHELNASDKPYARQLIKDLYKLNHPLTIKLLGDLCLKHLQFADSERYYQQFLQEEPDTVISSEVYKQLGILEFQKTNLSQAKLLFLKSIKYGHLDKTVACHYYLGEMYSASDPQLARFHLQLAASKSFKEAFKSLGFLELNYFHDFVPAREWFKLGLELGDYQCLVGLFDTYYQFGKVAEAKKVLKNIRQVFTVENNNKRVLDEFLRSRAQEVKNLMK